MSDVLTLALAVARRWPDMLSNSVSPGWVPTKMGGPGAPDDLSLGHATQARLAVSDDEAARVTGRLLSPARDPAALSRRTHGFQDALIYTLRDLTDVSLPPE